MTQYLFGKSEEYTAKITKDVHQEILSLVVTHMKPERPTIDFDPMTDLLEEWDQRLVVPLEELEGIGKVRAHLTDHGSVEALREHSGMMVDTQYSVALMMESEA